MAFFAAPLAASAHEVEVSCSGDAPGPLSTLSSSISQGDFCSSRQRQLDVQTHAFASPIFVGDGSDAAPANCTWHRQQAARSGGLVGVVPTVGWNDDEQAQFAEVDSHIPMCVRQAANVRRVYRIQRNVGVAKTGVPLAVYGFDNSVMSDAHGLVALADAFFHKTLYGGAVSADQQVQAVLGFLSCHPPDHGLDAGNVAATVAQMPVQLQGMSRERVLFHEYIHGITHDQLEEGWTDPYSREGFFGTGRCPTCGASRFESLRQLFYGGDTPESKALADLDEQIRATPNDLAHRAERCALWAKRADLLASKGVPSRWPGDTHALEDADEYVTVLIEQAIYDPQAVFGPKSVYSQAEQDWVRGWWQRTFGAPLGQCGSPVMMAGGGAANGVSAQSAYAGGAFVGYNGGF